MSLPAAASAPINFDPATGRRLARPRPAWYIAGDMERAVVFEPGFNSGTRNYGVASMRIRWLLRGPYGATQFLLSTGWIPGRPTTDGPDGHDLGYHALAPQYEDQEPMGECEYLDGRTCYYDGSGLAADRLIPAFMAEGEPVIWRALQERYAALTPDSTGAVHR